MLLPKVQIRSRIFMVAQRHPPFLSCLLARRPQWCLGRLHSSLLGWLCVPGLTDLESKGQLGASPKARSLPLCPPGGFRSHHIASAGINHTERSHSAP